MSKKSDEDDFAAFMKLPDHEKRAILDAQFEAAFGMPREEVMKLSGEQIAALAERNGEAIAVTGSNGEILSTKADKPKSLH
jgi:hypothetical protein